MADKKEPVVVKGSFSFKSSTGNDTTLGFFMPQEVASCLFKEIMDWRENWQASFSDVTKYNEAEKQFIAELEKPQS